MLKAKLLKDGKTIYYQGEDRTYSLTRVIELTYTDFRQPLRENLRKIIDLRNDSTHYITEDYESVYAPLFQANVRNYCDQIKKFHGIDMTKKVAQNFLTLSVGVDILTDEEIKAKYSDDMAQRLIKHRNEIDILEKENTSADFYIPVRHDFYQVKKREDADFTYSIDKNASSGVKQITRIVDPQDKYRLTAKNLINAVNKRINAENLSFDYRTGSGETKFNMYTLNLFNKFYSIKKNDNFCYKFENVFRYSTQLVDFIIEEIRQRSDTITVMKEKIAPGS